MEQMELYRWEDQKSVFQEALDLPQGQWRPFVRRKSGGDSKLEQAIFDLLDSHTEENHLLDQEPPSELFQIMAQPLFEFEVGPYRLTRQIGEGGMGRVYLAERVDGFFEQQVAVKLMRPIPGTGWRLIKRFEQERHILASLDHPAIARLLDAGICPPSPAAPEGAPYLVMEYVDGLPLDVFCKRYHLSVFQTLKLFRRVCQAVAQAHDHRIVHRDIKPSNVLVTLPEGAAPDKAEIKLLDFGIAKLIGDASEQAPGLTGTGFHLMTPQYASPEQVRGEAITPATDVYALGLMLYEIISGSRPYDVRGRSPAELELVIGETEPIRPSLQRQRLLDDDTQREKVHSWRDLDAIILKALRKDPDRRYPQARSFAQDIRRYMKKRPVGARSGKAGYRMLRFVQRRGKQLTLATVLLIGLAVGGTALWQQMQRANSRANEVRRLANTLVDEVHASIRDLPGATQARQQLVTTAITFLDQLSSDQGQDPEFLFELAAAYDQVGRIQGDPHYTNLGDLDGATESYHKALSLREEVWQREPGNSRYQHALGDSYGRLAVTMSWGGKRDSAIAYSERGVALLQALEVEQEPDIRHDLGRMLSELGWYWIWQGRRDEGIGLAEEGIALLESVPLDSQDPLYLQHHTWRAYSYLIDGLKFSGSRQAALDLLEEKGIPLLNRLKVDYPTQPRVLYELHVGYDFLGDMRRELAIYEGAAEAYEESAYFAEQMVAADSLNVKGQEALARAYASIGALEFRQQNWELAAAHHAKAFDVLSQLRERFPENVSYANMTSGAAMNKSTALLNNGQALEAHEEAQLAVTILGNALRGRTIMGIWSGNLAQGYATKARALKVYGDLENLEEVLVSAVKDYRRSLSIYDSLYTIGGMNLTPGINLDTLRAELSRLEARLGDEVLKELD